MEQPYNTAEWKLINVKVGIESPNSMTFENIAISLMSLINFRTFHCRKTEQIVVLSCYSLLSV